MLVNCACKSPTDCCVYYSNNIACEQNATCKSNKKYVWEQNKLGYLRNYLIVEDLVLGGNILGRINGKQQSVAGMLQKRTQVGFKIKIENGKIIQHVDSGFKNNPGTDYYLNDHPYPTFVLNKSDAGTWVYNYATGQIVDNLETPTKQLSLIPAKTWIGHHYELLISENYSPQNANNQWYWTST